MPSMFFETLREIVTREDDKGTPQAVIRNMLKERLQYPALEFLYTRQEYQQFCFYGGTCLRLCFDSPRLSEDLDFNLSNEEFAALHLSDLGEKLKAFFVKEHLLSLEVKVQSDMRIYLKFPVLRELFHLSASDRDFLFLKLEFSTSSIADPAVDLTPISRHGLNFVVKHYQLPLLMAGKIHALFDRTWFQGKQNEVDLKGRDYYDLFWYFDRKVEPDWKALTAFMGISTMEELKKRLRELIERVVTPEKLEYDLKNFFPNQVFVSDFCKHYKEIMRKQLQ